MERQPADQVIRDCRTTSDKIRALIRAGYLRTEVARLLDVRYQRVRKVLVDAGITEGLRQSARFERSNVAIEAELEAALPVPAELLLQRGFVLLGEWLPLAEGEFELSARAPNDAGVYAFVAEDRIRYIGLTQTGLRTRMGHYRRGHVRQRTSARVKGLIAKSLAEGKAVQVLIAIPGPLEWNGLPVSTAAGLESGLIRMIRPEWNMQGVRP
ncbi:GIY-YIG nuclease family protein [Roseinatronobacter alkalisoli]|uniref:GIY-YIG nuclease family protein n=1 Tax=Roseinatronobacter alkalisoli TaxID=3028235 RepID=A0ABT5TFV4_9RHOB|nr:GIY-YIG nuclease family protein [Roseinatronobacter sp. HJB301]MDD7974003.1 GIY-YIG nuclease family protein [Roseinatronobacter sp. HJB301]